MINFNQFINEKFIYNEKDIVATANGIAKAISKMDNVKAEVHDLEFDKGRGASFEISIDGEESVGGSYIVKDNGWVINVAIANKFPNAQYARVGDIKHRNPIGKVDVDDIIRNIKLYESTLTEAKNINIKSALKRIKEFNRGEETFEETIESIIKDLGYKITKNNLDKAGVHIAMSQEDEDEIPVDRDMVEELYGILESNLKEAEKKAYELNNVLTNYDLELEDLMESVELVHVYDKDGNMRGTGELVKTKGKKSLIQWDGSNEEWIDSNKVELVEDLQEGRKVTLKRKYTENHPAITAGKHAKIRNKILEAIGDDGKITQEEFDNILKELSSNGKRWMRNNSKYFNVSEEGISLSKFGRRILQSITINETEPEIDKKPLEMKINEAKEETGLMIKGRTRSDNQKIDDILDDLDLYAEWDAKEGFFFLPEEEDMFDELEMMIQKEFDKRNVNAYFEGVFESLAEAKKNPNKWVPGEFEKDVESLNKITYDAIKKLAKKHKVFLEDAIDYVEYGWDIELKENKTNMKTQFIYESFNDFVKNEMLNESFKSMKLASLFRDSRGKISKELAKGFYQMAKIKLDQVEDTDIIEMDPKQAYKDKRSNAVFFYFTENEKENPYSPSEYKSDKIIPANTLLAIADGKNKFFEISYPRRGYNRKGPTMRGNAKRQDSIGVNKSNSKYGGTGLTNVKRIAEVADRAYVLDLSVLRNKYSTTDITSKRETAKEGAVAFMSDKEFRNQNMAKYNEILATRASNDNIDKMVEDSIDELTKQIKKGVKAGKKDRHGDIIIGMSPKDREIKIRDAANAISNLLSDYDSYARYHNEVEENEANGRKDSYAHGAVKEKAKDIKDRAKKIKNMDYAW